MSNWDDDIPSVEVEKDINEYPESPEEFYGEKSEIPESKLGEVASLANQQMILEAKILAATETLKELNALRRDIAQRDLPELMESLGLETFTTVDGAKISIAEKYYASITKANKIPAANWLIDNGQDALVKRDVHIPFQAGDAEAVQDLEELLRLNGFTNFNVGFAMHTGAVKSALKELIANGEEVPFSLFGLHRVVEANISL